MSKINKLLFGIQIVGLSVFVIIMAIGYAGSYPQAFFWIIFVNIFWISLVMISAYYILINSVYRFYKKKTSKKKTNNYDIYVPMVIVSLINAFFYSLVFALFMCYSCFA